MNGKAVVEHATILWRCLDVAGHDVAELRSSSDGAHLSGVTVRAYTDLPCRLEYTITCDARWRTTRCLLTGHIGGAPLTLNVHHSAAGEWRVDGAVVANLAGCEDVDLGFSPATNLLPIRRLGLAVGQHAKVRAAWVRFPELTVEVLEQEYTRVSSEHYQYQSAGGAFQRELTVDPAGFIIDYPGFWRAEKPTS
ncbi:MAG: putative glycolipid-binding domain-containing protein [Herpetosiphonaceae bacterium]|nr:putative glycolipid-binding domain-containing protein [Herpetosiphonaceae bacterium]